jgi:hypothetical protein
MASAWIDFSYGPVHNKYERNFEDVYFSGGVIPQRIISPTAEVQYKPPVQFCKPGTKDGRELARIGVSLKEAVGSGWQNIPLLGAKDIVAWPPTHNDAITLKATVSRSVPIQRNLHA